MSLSEASRKGTHLRSEDRNWGTHEDDEVPVWHKRQIGSCSQVRLNV